MICKCGHEEQKHKYLFQDLYSYDGICMRQIMGRRCIKQCDCFEYKVDNLKYLEMKAAGEI